MSSSPKSAPTSLVTGASQGIGLATAVGLARLGYRVALVCREPTRGASAAQRVRRASVGRAGVDLFIADLSSQRAVRRLAAEIAERHPRLDVLVNNAGIITPTRRLTEDGIEMQLAVNHLAPFLLTRLLHGPLLAAGASRVVVVSSQVQGVIRFDDLQGERRYEPLEAYAQSKLANVLFTYALAARWKDEGIAVNCLHPGVVDTQLLVAFDAAERLQKGLPAVAATAPGLLTRGVRLGRRLVRAGLDRFVGRSRGSGVLSPEDAARTTLYVATDPALAGVSGRYFRDMAEARSSPQSYDEATGERLWSASAALVGDTG